MPAAKKTTKRTAKKRDNGLWQKIDPDLDPEDRFYLRDFYYCRRHLAAADGDLKYETERDEMDEATCDGLQKIYERDGPAIFWETSRRLLIDIFGSIEHIGGNLPRSWRPMKKLLVAEMRKQQAREDARARQRVRQGDCPQSHRDSIAKGKPQRLRHDPVTNT